MKGEKYNESHDNHHGQGPVLSQPKVTTPKEPTARATFWPGNWYSLNRKKTYSYFMAWMWKQDDRLLVPRRASPVGGLSKGYNLLKKRLVFPGSSVPRVNNRNSSMRLSTQVWGLVQWMLIAAMEGEKGLAGPNTGKVEEKMLRRLGSESVVWISSYRKRKSKAVRQKYLCSLDRNTSGRKERGLYSQDL